MKSSKRTPSSKSISFSPEIEDCAQRLLNGLSPDQIPPQNINPLISYLQQYKQQYLSAKDYLTAQSIEDICVKLSEISTNSNFGDIRQNHQHQLEQRLNLARQEYQKTKQERIDAQSKFEKDREESLNRLFQEQDKELEKFDKEILEKIPAKFTKFSTEYLNLRKQEECMVQAKRYAEANEFKIEADKLEEIEMAKNRQKWSKQVKKLRDTLIAKQNQQKEALEDKWETKWAETIPKIIDEENRCLKTVKVIEAKINERAFSFTTDDRMMNKRNVKDKLPPLKVGVKSSTASRMRTLTYVQQTFQRKQILAHGSF
ncbi:hypothetical protein TRFO_36334 [Tritrichomonas foetus]|uniref:Uncharacterized protein n=1 Tax=Tritrichomonas foetus TaxID=1144522 RepID=A0A1J4JE42_9EUKA|nr:hypothetical protein TRFO_36334 [Tritrichomonas foetus]|eukprot:OHS97470.1 hypothetical protein TRFO_36334 [Tritrichomonas foetus]